MLSITHRGRYEHHQLVRHASDDSVDQQIPDNPIDIAADLPIVWNSTDIG
jgi:hypothetical protein